MATFVQSAVNEGASSSTPTLAATATSGNWLFACGMERSGATSVTTPTGWTKIEDRYVLSGDTTYRRSLAFFYKVSDGTENDVTITFSSGGTTKGIIVELSPEAGEDQLVLLDSVMNDDGTDSTSDPSLASGNTTSVSFTDGLLIGAFALKNAATGSSPSGFVWTGDLTNDIESMGGNNGRTLALSWGNTVTDGVQNETASIQYSVAPLGLVVGLAVFDLASGGAAPAFTRRAITQTVWIG